MTEMVEAVEIMAAVQEAGMIEEDRVVKKCRL